MADTPTNRLDGFRTWESSDPFEDLIGPFYFREDLPEGPLSAFEIAKKNLNGGGAVHGGCLMSFADFALFVIARPALTTDKAVTLSCHMDFIGAGLEGDLALATGEISRETRSLIFARGQIYSQRETSPEPILLATFSGIIKKIRNPGASGA